MSALDERDRQLRDAAVQVLDRHYDPQRHTTGVALRTDDGDVYTGISLKADTGTADVHAEPVAVGRAVLDGATSFDTVVAVQFTDVGNATDRPDAASDTRIVSPCGACRELLARQCPEISVVVPGASGPVVEPLSELLPH